MNKDLVKEILDNYLKIFPDENKRQEKLYKFLKFNDEKSISDWNNLNGHLTAGGFLYSVKTKRFLVLWHKDLNMFLYPGGHCEDNQHSPLETAMAEIVEETGISNFELLSTNKNIPIDIDTHLIPFNNRIGMPEHYHFDFRYLFVVEEEKSVVVDESELSEYKWIDKNELAADINFGKIVKKLDNITMLKI